jgi:NAD(P)-dependent dehydrogenase (short-subunit alcohol dehydrogenase family)
MSISPPVALVTGANKGIGLEIARQLSAHGYHVWLACRDKRKGEEARAGLASGPGHFHLVELDVTDDASVRAAAEIVAAKTPALDALVNNAGMNFGPPPPAAEEPIEQMQAMWDTNALGPMRVTQAFLPLLRKSKGARIVMMSSGLGSHARTLDPSSENWNVGFAGYCASKSALNMFALKLAKELMPEGIKVNLVDPGLTDTDLGGHQGRPPEDSAQVPVRLAMLDAFGPTGGYFHRNPAYDLAEHPW